MNKLTLFSAVLISCYFTGFTQKTYDEAKKLYDEKNYTSAITKFKQNLKKNDQHTDSWYYLGLSYRNTDQNTEAIDAFEKLEQINPEYWAWYHYVASQAHIDLDNFDNAIASAQKFLDQFPKDPARVNYHHMGMNRLLYARGAKEIRTRESTMSDLSVVGNINNDISDDYTPQVNPTGTKLYFTSVRKGGFDKKNEDDKNDWGEDVYVASLEGGSWGDPELLPSPINSFNNDFGSSFTGDGQTMVYVRCGGKDAIGNCDIYITQLDGDQWSEPLNMGNIVNSKEWDSQPTISSDGNKVIFTSQRPGGYGGSDLYMTEKNHFGYWGIPQNLGSTVNTPWTDKSPYLAPDGRTLYFSSYGHPGFGGADIFKSTFENGKWSTPINLGAPLNSSGEDNYFTISASGEYAYFASTRTGDQYDIYQINIPDELKPKPTVVVRGIVTNAKNSNPLGAWVLVEDINSGELIATNKSNSLTGQYLVVLPAGRNYSVSANSEGFFFYSQNFELPEETKYQEIEKNIELKPIEKGTKVVLNNIFFETGKADLKPISYVELNKAVELMKSNVSMVIEVGGHTDDVGSVESNMKLSHERAKSVREYLVLAGIASDRLQAKGYGESQPIANNETDEGRAANRRTEFIILEF